MSTVITLARDDRDVANLPWPRVEAFVAALLDIDSYAPSGWRPRPSWGYRSTGCLPTCSPGWHGHAGVRDVRNEGVLLRGVNNSPAALLDLCFGLLDGAGVTPCA
jgi:lysine 2,3-aminomutase